MEIYGSSTQQTESSHNWYRSCNILGSVFEPRNKSQILQHNLRWSSMMSTLGTEKTREKPSLPNRLSTWSNSWQKPGRGNSRLPIQHFPRISAKLKWRWFFVPYKYLHFRLPDMFGETSQHYWDKEGTIISNVSSSSTFSKKDLYTIMHN